MEALERLIATGAGPQGKGVAATTDAELMQWLADQIDYLMQARMDYLMSLFYTLDVDEAEMAAAIHPAASEPANVGLARILYERQCRRAETKAHYQSPVLDDDEAW